MYMDIYLRCIWGYKYTRKYICIHSVAHHQAKYVYLHIHIHMHTHEHLRMHTYGDVHEYMTYARVYL